MSGWSPAIVLPVLISLILAAPAVGEQAATTPTSASGSRWLGFDDQPLPFQTDDQVLAFLRTASVLSQKELTGGINRPLKMRLRDNGIEANAIFRVVDIRKKRAKLDSKIVLDFHDSYAYECAAWEVSRLLGIDNVPPCVARRFKLTFGSMQLWVENAMTETVRREKDIKPPHQLMWIRQKQTMRLFDALIYNFDRNQGNMLIDSRWKLWFIDHTRSFRQSSVVEKLEKIVWCEREIFERLQALDKGILTQRIGSMLTSKQVNMILKRRDKLVAHLTSLIERTTESAVLWDASTPRQDSVDLFEIEIDDDIPLTSTILEDP